jgi:uncharacterized membrane protein YdjX (TVP38/TMEM64 family)
MVAIFRCWLLCLLTSKVLGRSTGSFTPRLAIYERDVERPRPKSPSVVLPRWQLTQHGHSRLSTLRGGDDLQDSQIRQKAKTMLKIVAIFMTAWLAWIYRDTLSEVFDKEKLQSKTLQILSRLDELPKYRSYSLYILGMAVWETLGLSTIPVETAAGMIFGWNGIFLSGTGKLLGATLAFSLGRYGPLANWIQQKLGDNEFFQLIKESAEFHPLRVQLLLKLSAFPETIKNYGSGILLPIRFWMFVLGTFIHGWTYSAIWTYLGVDTTKRLQDSTIPADTRLRALLVVALASTPVAMAWWVRDLQKTKQHSTNKSR